MVKFFGAFSKNILFTPEGFSEDPCSTMYLIRYRCISCEHVLGMVSPSKIHHDTREGAERKKATTKVFGMYLDCITYVSDSTACIDRRDTPAIHGCTRDVAIQEIRRKYKRIHDNTRYKFGGYHAQIGGVS